MNTFLPFLVLDQAHEEVDSWTQEKLAKAGFRVVQTFDLQIARLAHPDCACPNHGMDACDCQLVILLVYRKQAAPVTLIIHGQDGKTWVSLATPMEIRSRQSLEASVRYVLIPPGNTPSSFLYENKP